MGSIQSLYRDWLAGRRGAGLHRTMSPVAHEAEARVSVEGASYVNFSSNDYLNLVAHPRLVERARLWAEQYGAGSGASRLVTGNLEPFEHIEARIAALKGTEASLVFASGFQANAAVLQALLDKAVLGAEPMVFADRLNHASMHFGCQAAGVRQHRYRHCDAGHLETLLKKFTNEKKPKFILTESVFSMDGDIAPLADIVALARQHGAFVVCDDAHATGVLGKGGKGLSDGADLVVGTFSKALGSFGAYVACTATLRDYLVNRCTGLIYSTALPPPVLGAIDASLDLLPELDGARDHVAGLARRFRAEALRRGYDTGASETQIVPVITGEGGAALALSAHLAANGIWATPIRPPTVPQGAARLRLAFSAGHRDGDLEALLSALETYREPSRAAV